MSALLLLLIPVFGVGLFVGIHLGVRGTTCDICSVPPAGRRKETG